MFARVFIFVACIAVPSAWAYSAGAPPTACDDMTPQHGVDPQKSAAPYKLELSTNRIRSNGEIELELRGKGKGDLIKGFLVQARVGNQPIGQFKVAPNNKQVQTISCGNGIQVILQIFKLVFFLFFLPDRTMIVRFTIIWNDKYEAVLQTHSRSSCFVGRVAALFFFDSGFRPRTGRVCFVGKTHENHE